MLKFFDYLFYRATNSKWYQTVAPKDTFAWGLGFTAICELFNIGLFLNIYGIIYKRIFSEIELLIIGTPILIFNIFRLTEKRYLFLREKYKDDPHRKKKGWFLVLYIVLTYLLYFISLFLYHKVTTKNLNY